MRFKGKNSCKMWNKLKCMGAVLLVLILLLCPLCVNAQDLKMIGTFGLNNYGPAAMDIVRNTTFNEDGTVTVSFDLKEEMSVNDFSMFVLRFRYDTQKMDLIKCEIGTVDPAGMGSGSLDYIPYSFISDFLSAQVLAAETICTLTFSVKDTSDSTDVFEMDRPYYWVDLGGKDDRTGIPNPVTVYMGGMEFYKINLYEGTVVCAHTNTSRTNVTEPICTEEGSYDTFCNTCRKIISTGGVIAAPGHNYGEWQPHDEKLHTHICANNSSHVENGEHRFGEWEIVTEATETAEGSRKKCCTDCEYILTERIDKLEKPNDSDSNISNETIPEAGDSSLQGLLLWSILCILSLSGVIIGCRNRSR